MFRRGVNGIICLVMSGMPVLAEESPAQPGTIEQESMENPEVGDHWTYETRDEITGTVKSTTTQVVTEVTPKAIAVRLGAVGNANYSFVTFNHTWDGLDSGLFRYTPNEGLGVRMPLEVGKKWKVASDIFNSTHNTTFKRSGTAAVTARESVTTRAGTFDAFKLEIAYSDRNAADPTKKADIALEIWYAPSVDHFVKRTQVTRSNGQVRENMSMELVEFGRR